MDKETQEQLIQEMIKSPKIRALYDEYIIKEVEYEHWVQQSVKYLLNGPKEVNIKAILDEVMKNG